MRSTQFITPPLSIALDLVRVVAAIFVLVGHGVQLGLYGGSFPFSILFQHNAVIVFFVLSGLVITASVDRGVATLASFTLARAARILPVAMPALLLSLAVVALDAYWLPQPIFKEDAGGAPPLDFGLALLFLSESYQTGLDLNPPYWSLCYEVWFYALFAAATFLDGRKRLIALVAFALIAGPNVLLLLPVWLVGVALARLPAARRVPPWLGTAFIALAISSLYACSLAAVPLHNVMRTIVPWKMGFALYALSDLILAVCIALGFAGLRAVTADGAPLLDKLAAPIRLLANSSFSLYLIHWPLLKLLRMMGVPPAESVAGFALVLIAVIAMSAAFATMTEQRRNTARAWLERLITRRREIPTAA